MKEDTAAGEKTDKKIAQTPFLPTGPGKSIRDLAKFYEQGGSLYFGSSPVRGGNKKSPIEQEVEAKQELCWPEIRDVQEDLPKVLPKYWNSRKLGCWVYEKEKDVSNAIAAGGPTGTEKNKHQVVSVDVLQQGGLGGRLRSYRYDGRGGSGSSDGPSRLGGFVEELNKSIADSKKGLKLILPDK